MPVHVTRSPASSAGATGYKGVTKVPWGRFYAQTSVHAGKRYLGMFDTAVEGFNHFRRRREIHVSDPEGLQFWALIPFQGTGSTPAGGAVKGGHERER